MKFISVMARSEATKQSRIRTGLLRSLRSLAMTIRIFFAPSRLRNCLLILSVFLLLFSHPAAAENTLDYSSFRLLPVLDEGRVKPLDSYARIKLRRFSGRENIEGLSATEWLAETLFDPPHAAERKIFYIPDPELRARLGLAGSAKFFALAEIQAGLEKIKEQVLSLLTIPDKDLTAEQRALLQLQENVISHNKLLRSLSLLLPLNVEIPASLAKKLEKSPPDYMSLLPLESGIMQDIRSLIRRKGENPDRYKEDEKKLAALAFSLQQMREGGAGNDEFRIIPGPDGNRVSPWQIVLEGKGTPSGAAALQQWKDLAFAYRAGDVAAWSQAAAHDASFLFRMELVYNALKPFRAALVLYSLSIALLLLSAFPAKAGIFSFLKAALGFSTIALTLHVFGIAARVLILSRPPVGTLYEAVLFVSALCAAIAILWHIRKKDAGVFLAGLIAAAALLVIAPATLQKEESMEMLVAVLNTNFWLTFHVLCITAGYAVSIFTACLAHAWFLQKLSGGNAKNLQRSLYTCSLAALFFTALGTALGGIWADQSWGRFWGWDPKENGALLIVLWLIWLQHGRIGKNLDAAAFAAGTAFLNVIVALAWFGVNLLNTGLHSYGFTSGIAFGLLSFCLTEIFTIGVLWYLILRKERTAHVA